MTRPRLLSIAGSDPSGGAGVLADIKTFSVFGCYGMGAITALTAQNTRGVSAVWPLAPEQVAAQIDAVFDDIRVDAVKVGMLARADIADAVGASLARAGARNIVIDPVLAATQGAPLSGAGMAAAILRLAPLARLITPNLDEAAALTGMALARTPDEMAAQGEALIARGACAVLVTGGHLPGAPHDVLVAEGRVLRLEGRRAPTRHTHGGGCALSSAIAALLAQGAPLEEAARRAKKWLAAALAAGASLALGDGRGPPDHLGAAPKK